MKVQLGLFFSYAVSTLGQESATATNFERIHQLHERNYEAFVKNGSVGLITFYSPECEYSRAVLPEIALAANQTQPDPNFAIGGVDCTKQVSLCEGLEIGRLPTLRILREDGTQHDYTGPRRAENMVFALRKQTMGAISRLRSHQSVEEFRQIDGIKVIGSFNKVDGSFVSVFEEAATSLSDLAYFGLYEEQTRSSNPPSVTVYGKTGSGPAYPSREGNITQQDIAEMINAASVPLLGEVNYDTYQMYQTLALPIAYTFFKYSSQLKYVEPTLLDLARKYRDKINFVMIDANEFGSHAETLLLDGDQWPLFAIEDVMHGAKYPSPLTLNSTDALANLSVFVERFVESSLQPKLRSEAIPPPDSSNIKTIVGDTFQHQVVQAPFDVLLYFHMENCGYCDDFEATFQQLADMVTNGTHKIIFGKMNPTLNDLPYYIESFPTILLFQESKKADPVRFEGNRTLTGLLEFLRQMNVHVAALEDEDAFSSSGTHAEL